MNVRAIALAIPLALGTACMHTQGQGSTGAAAPTQQPQAAGSVTQDPIMKSGPAVQGHAGDEIVAGRIAEVSGDTLSIETQQGGTRTLQVVPETSVQIDGQDASFQDLTQGQQVRASFDVVGGQDIAVKIHAGTRAAPRDVTGTGSGSATDQGTPADPGAALPAPTTPPGTGAGEGPSAPPRGW